MNFKEIKKVADKEINDEKMKKYVSKYKELLKTVEESEKQLKKAREKLKEFEKEPDKFIPQDMGYYSTPSLSTGYLSFSADWNYKG